MVSMQMDENSPSPQPNLPPTPQCVGREFVRQYYTLLAEAPKYVHRFYSNESIFVHGTEDEIIGQTAIQSKIRDLSFEECRTRIRALDSHETLGKGVVVQVVGEISVNGGPMRRFVQTFVLAPQSEKKYYVHNDIFRYEDELFSEKIAQENGAPADPDAVTSSIEHIRRRAETPDGQAPINGNTHPEEIQNARFNLSQSPVQHPIATTVPAHQAPQPAGAGYLNAPASIPQGVSATGHPQVTDAPALLNTSGDFGYGSAITPAQPTVPQSVAPASSVTPYGQAPLPQRSQTQQGVHGSTAAPPPPPPPANPAAPSASLPSAPVPSPPEPTGSTGSAEQQQPQRPPSADKNSPAPSEEREETTGEPTGRSTWANVAKVKQNRSPHQTGHQHPPHAQPAPGTSAPAMLSPTGSAATHGIPASTEFAGRQQPQHQHPPNRQAQQYRPPRNNAHSGGASQDARASPAPSYGNRAGPAGGCDSLPFEQQVYVKNLPTEAHDVDLKSLFEQEGYEVLDAKVRRGKNPPNGTQANVFGFVAFDSAETAQKVIQKKTFLFHGVEIAVDHKRPNDRPSGGGGGNFGYSGRQYQQPGMVQVGGLGRGGANARGGLGPRSGGGGLPNRPAPLGGQNAYVGQGGGGLRQAGGGRTVYSSAGRGGGGLHPQ